MAIKKIKIKTLTTSINERYLEALRDIGEWATVSEWAIRVGERFPDLLEKANKEASNYKKPSTGLREIAARISSRISTGGYSGQIEVDESERPKKVRILSADAVKNYLEKELEEDLEPLTRAQKIKTDLICLNQKEQYRLTELDTIVSQLKSIFYLDFELEHAKALLNSVDPGQHHPDNIQILLKSHNRIKSTTNWARFTLDEQIEYINAVINVQLLVTDKLGIKIERDVITSILERLKLIY